MTAFEAVQHFDAASETAALGAKIGDLLIGRVSKLTESVALLALRDETAAGIAQSRLQCFIRLRQLPQLRLQRNQVRRRLLGLHLQPFALSAQAFQVSFV